ncbi:hypothetical protein BHM03_00046885 [Ensete ventricosum]|nr:hypothetical protein BHM03_00046885 [Ensete ventricosum]
MPKVSVGKSAPVGQATSSLPEVEEVHMEIAPRMSLTLTPKRLAKKSAPQQEDSARVQKQVKIVVGKHKSHRNEGSSRAPSKDKGSIVPREEPTPPTYCWPKSMKELCGTMVHKVDKGYYALQMTDLSPRDPDSRMWARWPNLKTEQRVVAAEQWVTDLQADNEKLMAQLVEATHRLELSDKELNDVRADLSDVQ